MTTHAPLSAWLRSRTPASPPPLAERIQAITAAHASDTATAESLLASAETAMTTLLRDGCLTREAALDLLAVDALVTFAFEAAADDPALIDERAHRALASIASLAEPYHA